MQRYATLIQELMRLGVRDASEPIPAEEIQRLRESRPGIPEDYLDFLAEVGWGSYMDGSIMIYGAPVTPNDIFDEETSRGIGNTLFVADDYAGTHWGYRPAEGWELVEYDHHAPDWPVEGGFEGLAWERIRLEAEDDDA